MTEIIYLSIGLLIGISIGIGIDFLGFISAKKKYDSTIQYKNDLIDKLTEKK